jgi:hypothetical protein
MGTRWFWARHLRSTQALPCFSIIRWTVSRPSSGCGSRRRRSTPGSPSAGTRAPRNSPVSWRNGRRASRKPPGLLALEDFLRLVDEMPVLEADNLHDFRKGAKKARYVAEAGGDEPFAAAIAKAIKRIQDVIGDWHDWLVLGEEAAEALDGDGGGQPEDAGAALRQCIAQGVALHFARAMRTTERMRRRLLGEWLAAQGTKGGVSRRARPARVTVTAADVARRQSL